MGWFSNTNNNEDDNENNEPSRIQSSTSSQRITQRVCKQDPQDLKFLICKNTFTEKRWLNGKEDIQTRTEEERIPIQNNDFYNDSYDEQFWQFERNFQKDFNIFDMFRSLIEMSHRFDNDIPFAQFPREPRKMNQNQEFQAQQQQRKQNFNQNQNNQPKSYSKTKSKRSDVIDL